MFVSDISLMALSRTHIHLPCTSIYISLRHRHDKDEMKVYVSIRLSNIRVESSKFSPNPEIPIFLYLDSAEIQFWIMSGGKSESRQARSGGRNASYEVFDNSALHTS